MQFTVSTTTLQNQLQLLNGAVGTNASLPILEDFLFRIQDGKLTLGATDLETSMTSEIDVMADSDGEIAIPAKMLLDVLKTLPEQPLTFKVDLDTQAIVILSQNGKYKMTGEPGDEFPSLPSLTEPEILHFSSSVLADAVEKTLFAVSTDELRPAMTGVYFSLDESGVTFVATDAQKLVKYKRTDITAEVPANFILPRKALGLLKNALPKTETSVEIAYDQTNAFFSFSGINLVCRLIEARYPDYTAVIPPESNIEITINRNDFYNALKRLSLFANKTTYQVNFEIENNEMQLTAQDLDFSNDGKESVPCQYEGDALSIAFNARFLGEILNVVKTEEVRLKMAGPNRAGIVVPGVLDEHEDILMLVMPIVLVA